MSSAHTNPQIMVEALRRSYWHHVADPKVFNTLPAQFGRSNGRSGCDYNGAPHLATTVPVM